LVRRGEAVAAFAARDGAVLWQTSLADDDAPPPAFLAPASAVLAVYDQRLCARTATGRVACLDLTRGGAVAWLGPAPASAAVREGGAPVACDRHVVFAELRAGALVELELVACDAAAGRVAWRRSLGSGEVPRTQNRSAAVLPELCGDRGAVYLCSQLGYVAAVEVSTGLVRWWRAYPRANLAPAGDSPRLALRDGGTIAVCGNLVVAAPLDAAEAFAWDAATGELRWRSRLPSPHARIIGSGGGKLWWGAERLWACDQRDGGWDAALGSATEGGAGGGLVAGGGLFWPRAGQIDILEAGAGRRAGSSWEVSEAPRVRLAADWGGQRVAAATATTLTAWERIPGAKDVGEAAERRAPGDDAPERVKENP
jgi:outer membrane protein assembly factor BamB